MRVEVLTAEHGLGDDVLQGGSNDVVVTAANAPLIAGAVAAGVLLVSDATDDERALLDGHVESQEDGEAAYAAAQKDGSWREGQDLQQAIESHHEFELGPEDVATISGDA